MTKSHSRARTSDESLALWRRVAKGERDAELDSWLQETAKRFVTEVFEAQFVEGANRRERAALKAAGFVGRLEKHTELARVEEIGSEFGMTPQQIAAAAPLLITEPLPERLTKTIENLRSRRRRRP